MHRGRVLEDDDPRTPCWGTHMMHLNDRGNWIIRGRSADPLIACWWWRYNPTIRYYGLSERWQLGWTNPMYERNYTTTIKSHYPLLRTYWTLTIMMNVSNAWPKLGNDYSNQLPVTTEWIENCTADGRIRLINWRRLCAGLGTDSTKFNEDNRTSNTRRTFRVST